MALEKRLLGSAPTAQHTVLFYFLANDPTSGGLAGAQILLQDQERSGKTSQSCICDPDVMNGDTQLIK